MLLIQAFRAESHKKRSFRNISRRLLLRLNSTGHGFNKE